MLFISMNSKIDILININLALMLGTVIPITARLASFQRAFHAGHVTTAALAIFWNSRTGLNLLLLGDCSRSGLASTDLSKSAASIFRVLEDLLDILEATCQVITHFLKAGCVEINTLELAAFSQELEGLKELLRNRRDLLQSQSNWEFHWTLCHTTGDFEGFKIAQDGGWGKDKSIHFIKILTLLRPSGFDADPIT